MGAVNFSLDVQLVSSLKKVLPLPVFFETGTFKGDTIKAMIPFFDRIITVELSEPLWLEASHRFSSESKVETCHGHSPDVIVRFMPALQDASVLYWLDAHWCVADDTSGEKSQCPLLEEIQAIGSLNENSVIIVDDARLFLAPPPAPHEVSQWPSFDKIITELRRLSNVHELMVINDVIVFYPGSINKQITDYARAVGVDWLRASQSLTENAELRGALEEKEAEIDQKEAEIHRKHDALMLLTHSIEEKESVIQELSRVVQALRSQEKGHRS
ncbi:hypothetical protein [Methylomonas rapida]|uniref:Uncharacterized protein n=1 Tax=Methylomonas rapida TaxID=2963939 RepID=A0ABY7GQ40_9GAMM|nr:hypothetical protein [Methylomonas rapida]WAR46601.1 hypothetical protein NM686_008825 [Methylomonas rapida]